MKLIKISENDIKNIVYEVVNRIYSKLPLNEYFVHRSKFVDNVWHLSYQIMENWCLIKVDTLNGCTSIDREHWKGELFAHLNNIGRDGIKGNNSVKARKKAVIEGFDMADLFGGQEVITKKLRNKFIAENINVNDEISQEAIRLFCNDINNIVDVISDYDNADVFGYINSI